MIKKYLIVMFLMSLLIVCGCDKKEKNTENNKQKEETKENIKVEENKEEQENLEEVVEEEIKEDNKQDITTNNTPIKPNVENNKPQPVEPPKEEIKTPSIIGTWIYNNGDYVYIFETDKLIEIKTKNNTIKEHTYTIDRNKIIIDEKTVQTIEISGDKLYLGHSISTKAPKNYKYPSIYYNLDIFYGTWKLEIPDKVIILEDGEEQTLEETMTLSKNNMSGFGSCGGSGCYGYIFNFLNSKPELYTGSLCYELVDNNTLSQIKCHSDNIIGWTGWEDETLHNIVYKRIG